MSGLSSPKRTAAQSIIPSSSWPSLISFLEVWASSSSSSQSGQPIRTISRCSSSAPDLGIMICSASSRMQCRKLHFVVTTALLFIGWFLNCHGRSKLGFLPKLLAIQIENDRNRYTCSRQTTQERTGIIDPEAVKHLSRKQWKAGGEARTEECVGCYGGCSTAVLSA